jgi:hypothetical protein
MKRYLPAALTLLLALGACSAGTAAAKPAKTYRGKLEVRHSDDFAHGRGQTTWTLRTTSGKRIPVLPSSPTTVRSGSKVTVRGRKTGRFVAGKVRRRGPAPLHAATATGNHKVAVILIKFAGDTEPFTPAQVNQSIFTGSNSTAAFYDEESLGDMSVSGDVLGWYTIAGPHDACQYGTWAGQAQQAAANAGVNLSTYDNLMYVFPDQSSCGWAGLGEVPGGETWLNGDISVRVAAHELGHNFGLHHASSYSCTSGGAPVTLSSSCSASEYGDPFDVMGLNPRHSNSWHLQQLGVVRPSEVQTASASGTYTLRSADTRTPGTALLRVPAGGSPARWYDLSIRKSGGVFDSFGLTAPVVNGVSLHYDPSPSTITQSLLLDGTPGSGSGFTDAALPAGGTFSNGSVSITPTAVSAGSATVSVVMDPASDTQPPSVPAPVTGSSTVPGAVALSWGAASDNVGVAGYRVYRNDVLVGTTPGLSYADSSLVPGSTQKYRVAAFDAAGNSTLSNATYVTVKSNPVTPPPNPDPGSGSGGSGSGGNTGGGGNGPGTPPGDSSRPVVRVVSPGNGARLRGPVAVIRAGATDNVRVTRLELSIDGHLVTVSKSGQVKRTWKLRRVRPGKHLILVRAHDASGNFASRVITVKVVGVSGARRR